MRLTTAVLIVLGISIVACQEPGIERTAADALALGYEAEECEGEDGLIVYSRPDSISTAEACEIFDTALSSARASGLVDEIALDGDSITLAVVTELAFAETASRADDPKSGWSVTISLESRTSNLRVVWPGGSSPVETSWSPEGLAY